MKDAGRLAVTAKYGEEMWGRIERWPEAEQNFGLIYGLLDEVVAKNVDKARANVRRARSDKRYALEQAEAIDQIGGEDFSLVNVQAHIDTLRRKAQETAQHYAEHNKFVREEASKARNLPTGDAA